MIIKSVNFVGSFEYLHQCPRIENPEYAFIGRSNVGKSSLINMITGRKSIARVSVTPGKTQTINLYEINNEWTLTDLPGYGYAKVSKKNRAKWKTMIEQYLLYREQLMCTFVLLDSRLPLQKLDNNFIAWLGSKNIPFVLVYTKTDKLKKSEVDHKLSLIQNELLQTWENLPDQFVTSAEKKIGREEILEFIDNCNKKF